MPSTVHCEKDGGPGHQENQLVHDRVPSPNGGARARLVMTFLGPSPPGQAMVVRPADFGTQGVRSSMGKRKDGDAHVDLMA